VCIHRSCCVACRRVGQRDGDCDRPIDRHRDAQWAVWVGGCGFVGVGGCGYGCGFVGVGMFLCVYVSVCVRARVNGWTPARRIPTHSQVL